MSLNEEEHNNIILVLGFFKKKKWWKSNYRASVYYNGKTREFCRVYIILIIM